VGTDKRERQKANRQQKLEEMARDARRQKTKRRALQIGIGVPALIAVAFLLVRLLGGNDDNKTIADASTTTIPTTSSLDEVTTTIGTPPSTIAGGAYPCPPADGSAERVVEFPAAPPMCIDPAKTYTAEFETNMGNFTAELDPAKAPLAVNNLVYLTRYHFFDGVGCDRVVQDFVVQCGDPTGTGSGGPGYSFADELPATNIYEYGALAMANSGPNTNGSQFFVVSGDASSLQPNYTYFGHVTEGMDTTVQAINALGVGDGPPSSPVKILSVTITES
jgi:cyclophilin family peptidyl-prolyl cis-trans isomerase